MEVRVNARLHHLCPGGGIGRRAGFRYQWLNGRGGSSPLLGTMENPGLSWLMTLRGFLVLWDPARAPEVRRSATGAPPPGPTAGTLDQETWPRHRDPNRPSLNRDAVNSPKRPPGLGVTLPASGHRWRGFIREDQAVAPKAAPSPHATRLRGLRSPTSRRCQQGQIAPGAGPQAPRWRPEVEIITPPQSRKLPLSLERAWIDE